MGGADPGVPALPEPLLTPELRERIRRMAEAEGKSMAQIMCLCVTNEWLRWGGRRGLKPGEW